MVYSEVHSLANHAVQVTEPPPSDKGTVSGVGAEGPTLETHLLASRKQHRDAPAPEFPSNS